MSRYHYRIKSKVMLGSVPLVNYAGYAANRLSANRTATNLNICDLNSTNNSMAGLLFLLLRKLDTRQS